MVKKIILACFTFILAILIGQASRPTVAQTQYLENEVILFAEDQCEFDDVNQHETDESTDQLLLFECITELKTEEKNEIGSELLDDAELLDEGLPSLDAEDELSETIDDLSVEPYYEQSRNSEDLPVISTISYIAPTYVDFDISPNVSFDTAFDPRENRSTLTPVKNQGQIDVCWTFAANAVLESFLKLTTGIEYNFSEEHMRFATSTDGGNWLGFDRANHDGGSFPMASAYWMRQSLSGPVLASNDPSTDREFTRSVDITASIPRYGKVTDTRYLPTLPSGLTPGCDTTNSYINQIKRFIVDYGSAYIYYSHDEEDGISWQEGPNGMLSYYQKNYGFYHAAVIVGWDDDYCVSNFYIPPPGNGAWLVKNSWGTDWSDGGFFWMSYHTPIFGVATVAGFQKNFSYAIFCYTPFGSSAHIAFEGIHTIYSANIFDCNDPNAVLRAIQFYNKNPNSSYSVYVGVANRNEISDEDLLRRAVAGVAVTSGTFREKGFYTIDLGHIALGSDKIFAVVVKVDTAFGTAVAPLEANTSNSRQSPGQSFISSDSFHWWDTMDNGNITIQAIVSNGTGSTNAERLP